MTEENIAMETSNTMGYLKKKTNKETLRPTGILRNRLNRDTSHPHQLCECDLSSDTTAQMKEKDEGESISSPLLNYVHIRSESRMGETLKLISTIRVNASPSEGRLRKDYIE